MTGVNRGSRRTPQPSQVLPEKRTGSLVPIDGTLSAHALSFPPDYSRRPSGEKTTLSPNIVSEKPEPKQNSTTRQTFPMHPHFQTSSWRTGRGDRNSTLLARTPTGTAISDHSPVKRKMSGASHSAPSCPPQRTSQGPQQGWTNPPDLRLLPAAAPHQTGSHLCLFNQSPAQTCNFQKRHMRCFSCLPSTNRHFFLCTGRGCLEPNSRICLRSLFSQWS